MTRPRIILTGENIRCMVDQQNGGRVSSLIAHGRELLVTQSSQTNLQQWGLYPMAPYAGRVRNGKFNFDSQNHQLEMNLPPHAIHGTVFDRPFMVVESSPTSVRMQIDLGPQFRFYGQVTQTITVEDNMVNFELELSTSNEKMPGQVGWHPWFARPCRIETAFKKMYVRDKFVLMTFGAVQSQPKEGFAGVLHGLLQPNVAVIAKPVPDQKSSGPERAGIKRSEFIRRQHLDNHPVVG